MWGRKGSAATGASFFARFRRNVQGNTLAMMAIALVPLSAMAGSAVDMGRLYVVKVRLQQACDAGVLAGRKNMVSAGTTLDAASVTQATTFFRNNFREGWMNTSAVAFTPSKTTENQVSGTATATVPMSIMKMFAMPDIVLNLVCEARYDVADTDVMFVLDTTGSMACAPEDSSSDCSTYVNDPQNDGNPDNDTVTYTRPNDGVGSGNTSIAGYPGSTGYYVPEKSNARIKALRSAVLSFYDTLDSTKDPTTNVRYGFVTYTSTVNAGKAIMDKAASNMVGGGTGGSNWTYQTRKRDGEDTSTSSATYNITQSACNAYAQNRTPANGYDSSTGYPGPKATMVTSSRNSSGVCTVVTTTYLPKWVYGAYAYDVSGFVAGNAVDDPTKVNTQNTRWQGCIEERGTTPGVTSFSTDSLPGDLNPDLPATNRATRWRPMWPEVIYDRGDTTDNSNGDDGGTPWVGSANRLKSGYVTCGKPVQRLTTMTRSAVSAYVNASDFRAIGGTYHDTGMIWGTRMLSPTGPFASDTAAWPGRQLPNRVLIFMTDGDMSPGSTIYGMYALEKWDQRVTGGDYTDSATYKNYHNQRFLAECSKAKALGIDVWVVAVGQAVTDQLKACASSTDQAIYAGTSPDVSSAFADIARHVGALRISR